MSSPRFEPWLMPETTASALKSSTSPSLARRTQSTGVPSVAKPYVPSWNSTRSTHSGRRVVIERAMAERLPSGAMTASSMPGTMSSSARRSACSPSALIPSSLVSRTRTPRTLVPDPDQIEPVCGSGNTCFTPVRAFEQLCERFDAPPPGGDLEHRPDEDPVHLAHEGVGLDLELEDIVDRAPPAGARHDPPEAHVVGLGRLEGGEVVLAAQQRRARLQRGDVDGVGPVQRAPALERIRRPA